MYIIFAEYKLLQNNAATFMQNYTTYNNKQFRYEICQPICLYNGIAKKTWVKICSFN